MRTQLCVSVILAGTLLKAAGAVAGPGIYPDWPAGPQRRGAVETTSGGVNYTLLGVGYCRGGPPGGTIATAMPSYVRLSGGAAPKAAACFEICNRLARCAGVELRNSDDWCELQIPSLSRVGDGKDQTNTDWYTGADAAAEIASTSMFDSINAAAGSPTAVTTTNEVSGFYCWGKLVACDAAPRLTCESANRYPCQESYTANMCGPCEPLHVALDGLDPRLPGPPASKCVPDPAASFPTLKVSLASPWFGGRGHEEALYLTMVYGVKKAWLDGESEDLIPIPLGKRMPFLVNLTGHTATWGYTLSADQLAEFHLDPSWETRVENHPMSGIRAMAALKQDAYTHQYGLMELADPERTKPHCIIGGTPLNSMSGVFPHSNVDLPLSHVATFYETPVLGWAFQSKEFADKTNHKYYLRVNRVGLDSHLALVSLIEFYGYTRIGVVTPGTNRRLVRGLQETLDVNVVLWVEDMGLQTECGDGFFEYACHAKLIASMDHLRQQDVRVIIHEHGGVTQLDNYWASFAGLLRKDTLLVQVGVLGDCSTPMLPPTTGEYGLDVLWENIRKGSNMNNRGEWDKMPGNCRVCPNWAFRDLPREALANRTLVAQHNSLHVESVYGWSSLCPELPTMRDILSCAWCDPQADFWIAPACDDELDAMRSQLTGALCIGVARQDNEALVERWTDYLGNLTADELVAAGAPQDFFQIFMPGHPFFESTGVSLANRWQGPWRRALREKAALLDSLLLALVAFNSWVRAAGESSVDLSATELRTGFRTFQNTAIVNWRDTIETSRFEGLTGRVQFNPQSERLVDYSIYSARGPHLAYFPVAAFAMGGALTFTGAPLFNDAGIIPPTDREPGCAPGTQYSTSARGCSKCPVGFYCPGDPLPQTRVPAIACGPGTVAPSEGARRCKACPAGTVPDGRSAFCLTCPEGNHADVEGSLFCTPCSPGTFWALAPAGNASGSLMSQLDAEVSVCTPCPRGSYQDGAGESGCRPCGLGQQTFSAGAASLQDCLCPEKSYLPADAAQGCLPCPEGMSCLIGSDMANYRKDGVALSSGTGEFPKLLPRFWSTAEMPLSVYLCLDKNVCPGGLPGVCGLGTTDIACAKCPVGTYFAGNKCVECNAVETSKLLFPILPCIMLCPAIALLYLASRTPAEHWSRPQAGLITCAAAMLMHFQIQGMLWKLSLYFPQSLGNTWGRFNELVTGLSVLRPHCAGVVTFQHTYYLNVAMPVFVLFAFLVTFSFSRCLNLVGSRFVQVRSSRASRGAYGAVTSFCKQVVVHRMDSDCLFSAFGAVMETFFVAIAVLSMSLFHCYRHPNGETSLYIAPDVLCDSAERQGLLAVGVGAIAAYCVAGLVLILWVLAVAPRRFEQPAFRKRWRFLLAKYRPDVHWWSAVMLVRGLLLALATIIFRAGRCQLLYVIAVMLAYGFWTNHLKPWRHTLTNNFDVVMSIMLLTGASAMLRFAANPADEEAKAALDSTVTGYTQVTNFLPQGLALVFGAKLLMQYLRPEQERRELAKLAAALERMGTIFADSAGNGVAELTPGLRVMPEHDRKCLGNAVRILLSEDQLRLTNLRKTLSRSIRSGASIGSPRVASPRSLPAGATRLHVHDGTHATGPTADSVTSEGRFFSVSV